MYNEEGESVWERELDIYGKTRREKRKDYVTCEFTYQGQYYDREIDLCYNRFRYYDTELGRYISEDPIGFASGDFNFYNYVDNPNAWVDVFGLRKKSSKRKPKRTKIKFTGRIKPRNKNEAYVMSHVTKHPENGTIISSYKGIKDSVFRNKKYNKMVQTINNVEIHYMAKFNKKGKMVEVTDFKFKYKNHRSKKGSYAK